MESKPDEPKRKLSRRRFIKRGAIVAGSISTAVFGYTWRIEPHWIQVVRLDLPIAKLPDTLVGKSLVQISDLHVGPVVDERYISEAMRRVSALRPDILVVTGDWMTTVGTEQVASVMRVLANLQPANIATIGILGNHDYGHGCESLAAADGLTDAIRGKGITMLRNQVIDVMGLQIGGVDDLWGPQFDPAKTISQIDLDKASLMLCHNPDGVDRPVWENYRGWILAGHTHDGQCKPPFLPPPLLPVDNRRYTAGTFDLFDGRYLYINRGLGYMYRVRFNVRPEITVFTLQRAVA